MGALVSCHEARDKLPDPTHLTPADTGHEASSGSDSHIGPRPHLVVGGRLHHRGQLIPQVSSGGLARTFRSRTRRLVSDAQTAIHGHPCPDRGEPHASRNRFSSPWTSQRSPTRMTTIWTSRDFDVGTRHHVMQARSSDPPGLVRGRCAGAVPGPSRDFGPFGSTSGQSAGRVVFDPVPPSRCRPGPRRPGA